MAKKDKPGFNSPFANLEKLAPKPAEKTDKKAKKAPAATPLPDDAARDAEEFLRAMGDVQRLGTKQVKHQRVEPEKRLVAEAPSDDALALAELQSLVAGDGDFRMEESEEELSGSAPGVSHELMADLRAGKFAHRRFLDLHGYHRDEAKTELAQFVSDARKAGERCVLVITGRGKSSPDGQSVLREALPRWLSRYPLRTHVLAFCTARRRST
jgi:DNA-nicking Smr family endonuclease